MIISVDISEKDMEIINEYAKCHNIDLSELFRNAVIEKIENEYDLSIYNHALKEYHKDSKTYQLNEVEKELGLNTNYTK